ncbi:archaeosortase A [Haloferax larsenii]|uniref:Archaeosortase A, PGF-CTERM-specific n=1 Tax=Haloferax larsenii TaxID=302484 RepID=A0A1H7HCT6_HALLR|nr:archaeosortase A [Haloferax larsenii]SEK48114.1 archaeosortase A, PGF-CTERM-specific [Haloferax larsenii]
MPGLLSDILAWVVIATFVAGVVATGRDRGLGRNVMTAGWVLFALFWLQLIPHFTLVHKSYIEGLLTIAAVPASLYAGWLLYSGRDSLFVLSRAVAAMGVVYLPFETIPALTLLGTTVPAPRGVLMETVAAQTNFLIESLGYSTTMITGDEGYLNTFLWMQGSHRIEVSVVLACTGLGSIAIFAGLIAAVDAPIRRKARGLAIAVPIIYALNLFRTTFITISVGKQYFHLFVDEILFLFGSSDPYMVSFFISDRIISQVLAVVALIGITYLVVQEVPELLTIIEDVLYMITGEEHDLRAELGIDVPDDRRA